MQLNVLYIPEERKTLEEKLREAIDAKNAMEGKLAVYCGFFNEWLHQYCHDTTDIRLAQTGICEDHLCIDACDKLSMIQ